MTRMRAKNAAGGTAGGFFRRIYNLEWHVDGGTFVNSVENRAYASYVEIDRDCTVESFYGTFNDVEAIGNIQMGLYDSSFALKCATATTALNTISPALSVWLPSTTNPKITAGVYWLAVASDVTYTNGVDGFAQNVTDEPGCADIVDSAILGNQSIVRMDAAYPLPAVFIPVDHNNSYFLHSFLRVSV